MSNVAFGQPQISGQLPLTTGKYVFVHSGTGSNNNNGRRPDKPLATIDAAIGLCTASKGDVIVVMPGHSETIIAGGAIAADVAGITIWGIGDGTMKPTVTFGTSTAADINVSALNVKIHGLRLVNDIDSLVNFIDVDEERCIIEDCDFVTSSTKEALGFVNMATTKDWLTIRRCTAYQPTDPTGTDGAVDTGFLFLIDSENITVEDCHFRGSFETAIFHNRTTACKNLFVKNCTGIQELSGAEPFQLVAGATGANVGGGFITPAETAATEATLIGTLGDGFFALLPGQFGNDGGAGGQGGITPTTAS